ncbi:chorismate synthase, partial [Metarhizium majus ARSEF 297]
MRMVCHVRGDSVVKFNLRGLCRSSSCPSPAKFRISPVVTTEIGSYQSKNIRSSFPQFSSPSHKTNLNSINCPACPPSDTTSGSPRKHRIGGTVTCIICNAPSGLGEPAFNKLKAVKGFKIGFGFLGAERNGSRDNDPFIPAAALGAAAHKTGIPRSRLHTKTDNLGGISNGMPIFFRVAFKPPATISQDQTTALYDATGEGFLSAKGPPRPMRGVSCGAHYRGHGGLGYC